MNFNPPNRVRGTVFMDASPAVTSGMIYWVSSTSTGRSDQPTEWGKDPSTPFATLDYAIARCTANNGDIIYLMPNHAESLAAADAVDFDVAGITVIGLGTGADRPTFTFATATAADVEVDAANTKIENCVFLCNIASQARMISLTANADGAVLKNCEFREGSASGLSMVEWTGAADDVLIDSCLFYAPTAATYDEAILIADTPTRGRIINCSIWGDFDEGGINNAVGNIATNFEIRDCRITNLLAGAEAIDLDSAVTGIIANCQLATDVQSTSIDPGAMAVVNVYWHSPGADSSSVPALPGADSASNFIGVDDADNLAATTNVADNRDGTLLERTETIIATLRDDVASNYIGIDDADNAATTANVVANEDGSILERLEQIQEAVNVGTGTSLAANESLVDVLYAGNGIATFPSAAIPANNVSIAEVLREVYDQADKAVTNTTAVLVNGTTLFTIAGGPIEILSLVARCVTGNDGTASTLQWSADPTDGAAVTISAASASIASVAAGGMVTFQGTTLATAPLVSASGANIAQTVTNGVVVGAGIITSVVGVGSTTGTWQHHMRYRPLSRGVTVS